MRDYYTVGKTLGRGACGRVSRCTSVVDGREFAVKEGLAHNPQDYTGRHGLLNELQIMQQLCLSPCAPALSAQHCGSSARTAVWPHVQGAGGWSEGSS